MATEEHPLPRLLKRGARALSDPELLAVLLGRGSPEAVELAATILPSPESLAKLIGSEDGVLSRHALEDDSAAVVLAAVEFGRRMARAELLARELLDRPAAVAEYLRLRYSCGDQEVLGALYLDVRHRLIAEELVFRGTLSRLSVEPRPIIKRCLLEGAAAILIFHTHPSGDPAPSPEDIDFTERMADIAKLMGVQFLDHMILGVHGSFVSLRQRMPWKDFF